MKKILQRLKDELKRINEKWGQQDHAESDWIIIITEELGEACTALNEARLMLEDDEEKMDEYAKELIECAASCLSAVENYERRKRIKNCKLY